MTYDFKGKVVAVTGGAGFGMGNVMAKAFFDAGASISICSRKADRVEKAVEQIGGADSSRCAGFVADMSDAAKAGQFIQDTVAHFGRIDVLVNNAGVFVPKPSVDVTEDDWDYQMNTKPKGYFFAAQMAARDMIGRGEGGSIINIGSVNAECKTFNQVVYATANAGVAHMTRCLAREWGKFNIRVNCIQPGSIPTEINYEKYTAHPELDVEISGKIALGKRGDSKNIADAAMFLASDHASYITGDVMNVDGGFLLYSI